MCIAETYPQLVITYLYFSRLWQQLAGLTQEKRASSNNESMLINHVKQNDEERINLNFPA